MDPWIFDETFDGMNEESFLTFEWQCSRALTWVPYALKDKDSAPDINETWHTDLCYRYICKGKF
jgi:hypothetical protein